MSKLHKSFIFFHLFLSFHMLTAQTTDSPTPTQIRRGEATKLAGRLRDGVLVVRLLSNKSQTEHLTAIINDPAAGDRDKRLARTSLEDIIARRDTFNSILRWAVDSIYRFSDVRYIYDSDYSKTDMDHNNRSFLNAQNRKDPSLDIGDRPFLILAYVNRTTSAGNSKQNFRLLTPDMKEAPREIQVPGTSFFLNILMDSSANKKSREAMIKKLFSFQERLNEYASR